MQDVPPDVTRAADNIKQIVEESIKEAIEAGELPAVIQIEGIRINNEATLLEVDLSNNTTMQIELGLPH